ncbi:putative transcriptional regulator, TetR family [Nocardia nova SH22a]|uniref:Putative transcriptional regulator, TetR family n=2 Tax=Nocardia nova TaxID=37330 RepID=W5TGX3_9NOCA|nr:putative transcriptional regulator, TetR family [Nocardia nova SH22a]
MGQMDLSDPRVRRSRAAIMDATIALVTERETSAISMTELAEAAGVSRPVLYQHYGDRDRILCAAMTALIDRELMPNFAPDLADPLLAAQTLTEHFAHHRRFYRALLLGPAALMVLRTITDLFIASGAEALRQRSDGTVSEARIHELAKFLSSGGAMALAEWLVDGSEPLDPATRAAMLIRLDQTFSRIRPLALPD